MNYLLIPPWYSVETETAYTDILTGKEVEEIPYLAAVDNLKPDSISESEQPPRAGTQQSQNGASQSAEAKASDSYEKIQGSDFGHNAGNRPAIISKPVKLSLALQLSWLCHFDHSSLYQRLNNALMPIEP
jgi:hypothetical protein